MQQRWIFGYGSLMWRPGFEFESQAHGRIRGFHRSLCVYSLHHRGTEALPGLVLGLDRGGSCVGVAFQIAPSKWEATLAYLREREQVSQVYLEVTQTVELLGGQEKVEAVVYIVDRTHSQYAGKLSHADLSVYNAGFYRSGADLAIIIITDTEDHSKNFASPN